MPDCNFVLLYVADPAASAAFYAALFDREPVEHSPAFAMFVSTRGSSWACGRATMWCRRCLPAPAPGATPPAS